MNLNFLKVIFLTIFLASVFSLVIAGNINAQAILEGQINTNLEVFGNKAYDSKAPGSTEEASEKTVRTAAFIINIFLGLIGIVFTAYLIYGGFLWMTAAGNQDEITKAKKIITNSVIAIVIILAAFAISRFVLGEAGKAIFG